MDWILGKKMKSVTKYIIFLIRYIKIIIMIILYNITWNLQVTNVVRDTLFKFLIFVPVIRLPQMETRTEQDRGLNINSPPAE